MGGAIPAALAFDRRHQWQERANPVIHQNTTRSAVMVKWPALIAAIVVIPSLAWTGNDRMVIKKSSHSVAATLDRLSEVLKTRGIGITARVDHAAAAEKVGQTLKPTQLL